MEQHPAEKVGRRAVARRLFEALCGLYPDRYIALVEPRDVATTGYRTQTFTTIETKEKGTRLRRPL